MLVPFAKFAGLPMPGADRLSPAQLYQKYEMIFAAGQRYARQFPPDRFLERVIPHRERLIRTLREQADAKELPAPVGRRPWTDDYNNLFEVLK